jgi:hypothetical protein
MDQPLPLFVFSDFACRDAVMGVLQLHEVEGVEFHLAGDCVVRLCLSDAAERSAAYVTTLRIPGGKTAFIRSVNNLWRMCGRATLMLCFHPELPSDGKRSSDLENYSNPSALRVFQFMGVTNPSDQELAELQRVVPIGIPEDVQRPLVPAMMNFDAFVAHFGGNGEGLSEIEEALRASMVQYEQVREARAKERVPVPKTWEQTLAAHSEPVEPNQPVCVVCIDKKATVCFVDCGHQVACDDCVREMWSRVDVAHECPVCKSPVSRILRPYWSASSAVAVDVEPEQKKHKGKE